MTDVAATTAEVVPAELEQFVALGLTGRRNALGDVLDENVTKTSTKTLVEKLHRLQSTDIPDEIAHGNTAKSDPASGTRKPDDELTKNADQQTPHSSPQGTKEIENAKVS